MKRTQLKRKIQLKAKKPWRPKAPTKKRIVRKTTKAAARRRKKGEWSTKTADAYFSIEIRDRDGQCMKCGCKENLTCSHYHRRGHSATRFCFDNCITLCMMCHIEWEGPTTAYTEFMIHWLGQERFIQLALKAGLTMQRSDAVANYKAHYERTRK